MLLTERSVQNVEGMRSGCPTREEDAVPGGSSDFRLLTEQQFRTAVKTVLCRNPPSTRPYQNETQFPLSYLKNANFGKARPPKSEVCGELSLDTGLRV
jgi:hypothetical protein